MKNFVNPFSKHQHRTKSINDIRWESWLRFDIPKFQGSGYLEELMDWIKAIKEVFEYKEVPNNKLVSLAATHFHERQQLDGNK